MRKIATRARVVLGQTWWWLRQVTGDAAYENYLRRAGRCGTRLRGEVPRGREAVQSGLLSPEEFYLDTLRRTYARVSRCC